ncbi:MAG: tetratricopeptide repeat protein [Thalassotalea sp.]
MIRHLSILGLTVAAALSSNIAQADSQPLSQLKQHIESKEYQQAFALADKLTYDLAGDVEFDFLAGLAAFGAGKYQQAVFAFERVVMLEPLSFHGRYYLALAYQKVDNLHAALNELDIISTSQAGGVLLTSNQINKISLQRQQIVENITNKKRRFSQDITLSVGHDSNINSGSSLDNIELSDGTVIPLFDSSKMISATAFTARYHGSYLHPFDQNQTVKVDFAVQQTQYPNHSSQKRSLLDFNISYKQKISNAAAWNLGVGTTPFWFAGDKYRTQNSVFAGWQQTLDRSNGFGLNAIYADVDHYLYQSLDLTRYQVNAYYRYISTVQHLFIVNTYQDKNKFDLTFNDKTSIGISYVLDYPIYDNVTGNLMLMHEQQSYDGLNTFNEYNDSVLKMISSRFNYTGFEGQLFQLQLNYQDKDVESDLAAMKIYEYHRFEANLKWKYNF